jgi:hypothetical protein
MKISSVAYKAGNGKQNWVGYCRVTHDLTYWYEGPLSKEGPATPHALGKALVHIAATLRWVYVTLIQGLGSVRKAPAKGT